MVIFRALDLTHPDHCMFWAACNLAYFGFLRSAEFTVPNLASYVPALHLGVADVAVDSHSSPSCLRLRIRASKTDPFRKGCFLHIGKGESPLCAIHSLLAYLTLRGDAPGPLFLFRDGRPLSRALLTSWLRGILSAAGIQGKFSSHSFRIGAATVAARNGIPDHQIQALGRWTSSAYLLYIRTPAESLSRLSKQLSLPAAQWQYVSDPSGSVVCALFCIAKLGASWSACGFLGVCVETVSAAMMILLLRMADLWVHVYWFPAHFRLPQLAFSLSQLCPWCGMYWFCFCFALVGIGAWKFGGSGPYSTLFAGPSFSKHLGGKGLVVAAHRVVMDTLRARLALTCGPTLFQVPFPKLIYCWWV